MVSEKSVSKEMSQQQQEQEQQQQQQQQQQCQNRTQISWGLVIRRGSKKKFSGDLVVCISVPEFGCATWNSFESEKR